jgi:hypothetical protein
LASDAEVDTVPAANRREGTNMKDMTSMQTAHAAMGQSAAFGGLAVAASGVLLSSHPTRLEPGHPTLFSFRLLDQSGQPLTSFVEQHERAMHLILVRRDLFGFQHLHPTMQVDGTWMTEITLPTAGVWRAFADFATDVGAATLGVDLLVGGRFDPLDLPAPDNRATTDSYQVTIHPGELAAGQPSDLAFQVVRAGQSVTDLEPYLGARGHLVALREGDLAFLHVHPTDAATPGPSINFSAALPTAGRYRLFLQFQHDGRVHTAAFTLEMPVAQHRPTGPST